MVINCTAVMYSEFDELFWLIGEIFVETNQSLPVFYDYRRCTNRFSSPFATALLITGFNSAAFFDLAVNLNLERLK